MTSFWPQYSWSARYSPFATTQSHSNTSMDHWKGLSNCFQSRLPRSSLCARFPTGCICTVMDLDNLMCSWTFSVFFESQKANYLIPRQSMFLPQNHKRVWESISCTAQECSGLVVILRFACLLQNGYSGGWALPIAFFDLVPSFYFFWRKCMGISFSRQLSLSKVNRCIVSYWFFRPSQMLWLSSKQSCS